jgi:hypothetical protein
MRYLFNLQHNTGRIIIEQRAHVNAFAEHATLTSHVMKRFECENALLRHGTCESMEKDLELHITYRYLSKAEHRLNYTQQQIDLDREEVDTHTHTIVHLENAIETQDAKLKERAEIITNL